MSSVTYGNVVLQGTRLVNYRKDAVMVGNQYVTTKHSITVRGVFNPGLNSYTFGPNANAPVASPGIFAPVTEAAVRNTLILPRGQLVIEAAGFLMTVSPPLARQSVNPVIPATARSGQAAALGGGVTAAPGVAAVPYAPFGNASLALSAVVGLLGSIGTATGAVEKAGGFQKFATADTSNGPVCGGIDIIENIGDKTFLIQATFVTWLRETVPQKRKKAPTTNLSTTIDLDGEVLQGALLGTKNPFQLGINPAARPKPGLADSGDGRYFVQSPLAAHEFDMHHHVDQDFFTTRVINGRCVFRRDVLDANKLIPDQLRYWLGHPVPRGMRRQDVQVQQLADGLTYTYQIIDRDRCLRFDPNIFTRVEMAYTKDVEEKGFMDVVFPGGKFSLGGVFNIGVNAVAGAVGVIGRALAPILRGQGMNVVEAMNAGLDQLARTNFGLTRAIPVTSYHIIGRFWGHPTKDYTWLEVQAGNFLTSKFQEALISANPIIGFVNAANGDRVPIRSPIQLATKLTRVTRDEAGRFIEIEGRVIGSILSGAFQLFRNAVISNAPTRNRPDPAPILANPMRGTYLGACVTRALRDPSDTWQQPQDPEWVQDPYDNSRQPGGEYFAPPGPGQPPRVAVGSLPAVSP